MSRRASNHDCRLYDSEIERRTGGGTSVLRSLLYSLRIDVGEFRSVQSGSKLKGRRNTLGRLDWVH